MKDNFISRWLRRLTRRSTALAPLVTPTVVMPAPVQVTVQTQPARAQQLNTALKGLNEEFVSLNDKLLELRDALETLRDALKQLEEANRKRAAAQQALVVTSRIDLN